MFPLNILIPFPRNNNVADVMISIFVSERIIKMKPNKSVTYL